MTYIDILFDGPPEHEGPRFIDIVNSEGKGVRIGQWMPSLDGMGGWKLRIHDITGAPQQDSVPVKREHIGKRVRFNVDQAALDYGDESENRSYLTFNSEMDGLIVDVMFAAYKVYGDNHCMYVVAPNKIVGEICTGTRPLE